MTSSSAFGGLTHVAIIISSLKFLHGARRDGQCYRSRRRRFSFLLPCLLPQGRPCAGSCCCCCSSTTRAPYTSKRQIGEICHALYTGAFTFAKRTNEQRSLAFQGTLPSASTCCGGQHCFYYPLMCPRLFSRPSSRSFPSSWPGAALFRSCLSMPLALAQEAARGTFSSSSPLSSWTAMFLNEF